MKIITTGFLSLILFFMLAGTASAVESLVDTVAKGCNKELKKYCGKVTPGKGRILACLYAHEDKLSGRCDYALYDAATQLDHFIESLVYVASECGADMDKYCASIAPGEGRLLQCLNKKSKKISKRCKTALKDVGLK